MTSTLPILVQRCARCGREMSSSPQRPDGVLACGGRGLCGSCHSLLLRFHPDELAEYPRKTRRAADLAEDWEILRLRGLNKPQAAAALGMKPSTFMRSLERLAARRRALAQKSRMTGIDPALEGSP